VLARLTLDRGAAADLFQELFLRLGGKSRIADAEDRAAYAFRAAIHLAMEWRRKRKRNWVRTVEFAREKTEPSLELSPLQRMIDAEDYESLLNALSELPSQMRDAFVMRFVEEESYDVIAGRLRKTPHQARGLCHSAIKKLRVRMRSKENPVSRGHGSKNGEPA
jgi:RNA polymerase sigma factor (sigma-70 family)